MRKLRLLLVPGDLAVFAAALEQGSGLGLRRVRRDGEDAVGLLIL